MKLHLSGNISSLIASYECQICSHRFRNYYLLSRHMRNKHNDVNKKVLLRFKCNDCGKIYRDQKCYNSHRQKHLEMGKILSCEYCDQKYTSKEKLEIHVSRHTGNKKFTCILCEKKFFTSGGLAKHKLYKHMDSLKKNYMCEICGKPYANLGNLRVHQATHTNESIYKCYECKREFNSHLGYINHVQHHGGLYSLKCKFCEKLFNHKSHLVLHEYRHKTSETFECNICKKQFKCWKTFIKHQKSHTGAYFYVLFF